MERTEALFHCETRQWLRFVDLCRARNETPGAVLRNLVRLEVQRRERRAARRDEFIDERPRGRLRLLVADAVVDAQSRDEARARLGERRLRYHPRGGGLLLIDTETGEILCKASEAGPAHLDLVRRFGTGFPDRPRPGLAVDVLRQAGNT